MFDIVDYIQLWSEREFFGQAGKEVVMVATRKIAHERRNRTTTQEVRDAT